MTGPRRWLRLHLTGNRQRYRNWLNRRAWTRGKAPLPGRVTRAVGSRMPIYRNRIHPATGRPRRDDARPTRLARRLGLGNARMRELHDQDIRNRQRELAGRAAARARALDEGALRFQEHDWERDAMRSRPGRELAADRPRPARGRFR